MVGGPAEASFLRSILEEVPSGIWVGRVPRGEVAYTNGALAAIVGAPSWIEPEGDGYRFEDSEGRPFSRECLPFTQVMRRLAPVVVDGLVIARADGRRVPVRALAKPLFDEAGELRHVMIAVRDITAERESAAEAVVARHKLRVALDHAPIILFAYDIDETITVSEGAGLASVGLRSGQLVGQNVRELYKDIPGAMEILDRALAGESFRAVSQIGDAALETWFSPLRGPGGELGGVLGVSTDITERRRMERQVDRAERLAALGRLAASVAHEINNPLSYSIEALRLMGDLVPAAAPAAARLSELVAEASDGMERVRLITRDLKAFSRWDEDVRSPQDLGQAISAAVKMVATRTGARTRVELRLGPPALVAADPTRLVQIFVNLVLNATDALPALAADRNLIAISTRLEGGTVAVEIADNGPGIAAGVRDRIFDPFFTTKAVGEGTGLGLFVTRNLVESLGGAIELDDAPGGGARFTIRLPLLPAPAAPPAPRPAVPAAQAPARGRVVIIDDEPQLAKIFGARLAKEFDVQIFTSGRAALEHLLAGDSYDLVFCDLMMPDVSGMQVFEMLRASRPGLERRIVFMTGGVFDPAVAEFLASVPNDCVDKPFDVRAEARRRLGAH